MSLVIHDKLDPSHPLIKGRYIDGADDQVLGNDKDGYSWGWRPQGIKEDEGFWLAFMPLPKILNLGKGIGRGAEIAAEEGGEVAAKSALTDVQLLTKIARKAEAAIGGKGPVNGTFKHAYASKLLERYQDIFGERGLETDFDFANNDIYGPGNTGSLDVVNHQTQSIYDYKFGKARMGSARYLKYSTNFPGYTIQIIRP